MEINRDRTFRPNKNLYEIMDKIPAVKKNCHGHFNTKGDLDEE